MLEAIRKYSSIILLINSLNSNAIEHFIGIDNLPIYIFILALSLIISSSLIIGFWININNILHNIIFLIIILSFAFIPFWTSYKNIIICVGPLAAYFVLYSLTIEEIKKITWIFLLINLPIAIYEYFTFSYLYDFTGDTYGEEFTITAYSSLMRSKGLFASCLGLGYFAMFASFIYNNSIKIITVSIILCLLGGSRQPLVLVSIVLIMYLISHFSGKSLILTLIIGMVITFLAINFMQQQSIERILLTADFQNDTSNAYRIFYWLLGINSYLFEYDLMHQLLGNMGYFQELIGANAESAWLTLLLDVGFIITSIYFVMFLFLLYSFMRNKKYKKTILVFLIFLSMGTVPLIYNFNQNMYFWIFIFTILDANALIKIEENENLVEENMLTHTVLST